MKKTNIILIVLLLILSNITFSQEKYSKVKIYPSALLAERNELLGQLEIDHYYPEDEGIVSEISETGIKYLKKTGIRFEILIDDVAEHFRKNNRVEDFYKYDDRLIQNRLIFETPCATSAGIITTPAAFTAGSMGGYYTLAEMESKMDALVSAYPAFVSKFSIGNTIQGRPIWCIKISDNVDIDESNEAEVLYTGLQHAREAISGTSLIFFMQYLAEKYGIDQRVTDIVNNRELFIIPCFNPDGYEYNRTTNPSGGGLWRKNRKPNDGGSFGVDLNRNWSVDWGNCAGASSSCGSSNPSSDTYFGTAAFSELETSALKDFITSHNFVLAVDQHCYGPYYSLPFGRPSLHTMGSVDQAFYSYTAALMGKYNCHRAGNSLQTVGYEVAGGMKDWLLIGDIGTGTKGKVYGMTGEAGGGGFWAPSSQIIPLSKGLCFQNLQAAYVAGAYFDVQDLSDIVVTSTTGNFTSKIRRVGVGGDSLTLSLIPIENIDVAGSPQVISTLTTYNDTYDASFSYTLSSTITNGKRVRYAWRIETGNYTYYDTVTKFYNPTTLLSDNMEGTFSTNWTATISPSGSNGWNFTTNGFYEGAKSLAESPTGDYTHSTTRRVTYKNALNLSDATGAYLSFWVKHRSENCNDKLRIQVSTNGGSTFTNACGINTISENDGTLGGQPALTGIRENWTRELVNLAPYIGFSNVRFRFEFTSNANVSGDSYFKKVDDGFYIDNLKIVKTTASPLRVSPTITETVGSLNIVVAPNPVSDQFTIKVNNLQPQRVNIQVTDVAGRRVYERSMNIEPGALMVSVNTSQWHPQVYFLRILNEKNELLTVYKIVKL